MRYDRLIMDDIVTDESTLTVAGIRAMKKQIMSSTVYQGSVFTGWMHPGMPLASVFVAQRTSDLLAGYLLNQRTSLRNSYDGEQD
jgi:hypothetical protein